jgi:hypothetical protein
MNSVCNICTEKYNKTSRIIIKCVCDFECCRSCAKTYILGLDEEPSCMSCKVYWDRKFISKNFTKDFLSKEYKKHRENLLFQKEIAMLPATQPYAEREIEMIKLRDSIFPMNKRRNAINDILRPLRYEYERISQIHYTDKEARIQAQKRWVELKREMAVLVQEKDALNDMIRRVKSSINPEPEKIEEKKVFVRKCPNGNCMGFLSTSLKCGLCNCWGCADCREVKGFTDEECRAHRCDPNTVATIRSLRNDTKPCPSCSAMIFKIEGCDQIYCVQCHTAFSWRTLRIDNGPIHNPHYFEYQRRINGGVMPRNPLDIQCGRELDHHFINYLNDTFRYPVNDL